MHVMGLWRQRDDVKSKFAKSSTISSIGETAVAEPFQRPGYVSCISGQKCPRSCPAPQELAVMACLAGAVKKRWSWLCSL